MVSNEQPSVPVTSEIVSNNYAQQKNEALCKEVKDLKQKNIEQDQELLILRANKKHHWTIAGPGEVFTKR